MIVADFTFSKEDLEQPEDFIEEEQQELSDSEVSHYIANGTLTEEAWSAHQSGASWQIQVR